MNIKSTIHAVLLALTVSCGAAEKLSLSSPDGAIDVAFAGKDGAVFYSVEMNGEPVIKKSRLGMALKDGSFGDGLAISGSKSSSHNSTWEMVWGQHKNIRNHYNELVLDVAEAKDAPKQMQVVFRAFNDGVSFRYLFPKQDGLDKIEVAKELTEVALAAKSAEAWFASSCTGVTDRVSVTGKVGKKGLKKGSLTPYTVKTSDTCYISLHEAGVAHAQAGRLTRNPATGAFVYLSESIQQTPAASPWRTITMVNRAGGLIESTMILNLNEPSTLADTSWIKPGKTLWDWRIHGAHADDGFEYGMTTESYIRYIDFAGENNIEFVMVDAEWYGSEKSSKSDPTTYLPQIDIPQICAHAKSKGVAMWLYINQKHLKGHDLDKTLGTYRDWGVAGIKHGFLKGDTQEHIEFSHHVVRKCAEHGIMYVLHEPNKPTGIRRTYPNYMSREFINSMLDGPGRPAATPRKLCIFPFVHCLAGPVDRSCGMFDLDSYISREKCHRQLPTTVVSQAAQCMVFPSGLLTLADHPDAYRRKSDLFEFISQLPMTWDETKAINAEIGRLVTLARRSGEQWFVASLADEEGRSFDLTLDFLEEGITYDATLYEDGEDADYHFIGYKNKGEAEKNNAKLEPTKTKRELYSVRKKSVKKGDTISVRIAPGGGHCMWMRPEKKRP